MCGLFGAIHANGFFNRTSYEAFVRLTDFVKYRGPDACGYVAFDSQHGCSVTPQTPFDVFLGHRRLSIIDLSPEGNQPLTNDGRHWIIFNGEIFNYVELRQELIAKGYVFTTQTDTEVILNIYKEYGEQGFAQLNGMWAFALLDLVQRKIILSRDRFSMKPLYFTRVHHALYFASEIKQLLPLLEHPALNADVMFAYLNQGLLDYCEETFFQGIRKVKPKCNLVFHLDSGKMEETPYWDYAVLPDVRPDEVEEQFRALFLDSVKIRLRSDVKIGALLSGGLDSSLIAVIASELQDGRFETYSVVSEDPQYSEEKFVDIVAKEKGIHNQKLRFHSHDVPENLDSVLYHQDEPPAGFSIIAQYKILEKIKAETDVTVVLSGQGGDEILGGYSKYFFFYLRDLVKRGRFGAALTQALQSLVKRTVLWQFRLSEARRYLPSYLPFLAQREAKSFLVPQGTAEPIWLSPNFHARQKLDIDQYSIPALAHYEDRNSMAHSLETRLPFLDHRLVDFMLNVSPAVMLKKGWTKYLLRQSFPELPEAIRWRRDKQGFIIPEYRWLKEDLSALLLSTFQKSVLGTLGIIRDDFFLDYYRRFQSGDKSIWYVDISRVLIAELWARRFFAKKIPLEG
jgi:asparagine synthase (glutamine-hydrolysing)